MGDAAVHEHRCEKRQVYRKGGRLQTRYLDMIPCHRLYYHVRRCHYISTGNYLLRYGSEGIGESLVRSQALQEDKNQDIDSDEHIGDHRGRYAIRVIIANW